MAKTTDTNPDLDNDMDTTAETSSETVVPSGKVLTKSNKEKRSILVDEPEILRAGTIDEIVDCLVRNGKDMDETKAKALVFKKVKDQLMVDLRSSVRGMLEARHTPEGSEESELKHSDEAILKVDWTKWTPAIRQTQDAATKLSAFLGPNADIDKLAQAIAQQKGIPFDEAKTNLINMQKMLAGE